MPQNAEEHRLKASTERTENWLRWGPFLSERQWGTVREDYSPDGNCWKYLPHEHARSRAYRWGEDGLLGMTDRECRLCFSVALWNGKDAILKERLYGLTNGEGNHGEDVKECYYYLDSTPTHSYMKALYKYPQAAFPYQQLLAANAMRGRDVPEFELEDTGVFDEDRYFDVTAEYAKAGPNDVLIRLTIANRGPDAAELDLLPTLWFRNTWVWGCEHEGCWLKPWIHREDPTRPAEMDHESLGRFYFDAGPGPDGTAPTWLFSDNETNSELLFGVENFSASPKDAINDYIVHGKKDALFTKPRGTKVSPHYHLTVPAGESVTIRLRLSDDLASYEDPWGPNFDATFVARQADAEAFYRSRIDPELPAEARAIMRQGYAGLLWSKQFYHYIVKDWIDGDPYQPEPPRTRKKGRNSDWEHLYNRDIISMPDKWEYPWYAAWDLAFHMVPFAKLDPDFAKDQIVLFLREWYMHPNGQMPAYEFALGDVNPPVHAWAAWRVYKLTEKRGKRDIHFLGSVFQKLLLNFTWWVNRKDKSGKHIFGGGFLGMDNVGVFDRSKPLPGGGRLEQADGTAWMAFYSSTMLAMAMELAQHDKVYSDMASKFFEHYVAIIDAINTLGGSGLWNEEDGFYYDQIWLHGHATPLKIRSFVGLVPLLAVEVLEQEQIDRLPGFRRRLEWFLKYRKDLARHVSYMETDANLDGEENDLPVRRLLAIPNAKRLRRVLEYLLDENEFLSPHGIRSMSKVHGENPFELMIDGVSYKVNYEPGDSTTPLFGGNSNWRGPIWYPLNYLLVEALERYHHFYGDHFKVAFPTGSDNMLNLREVSDAIAARLVKPFMPDEEGHRPCHGGDPRYATDPHWKDLLLFHEYFHGENGRGLGASHQTGWTALVTQLIRKHGI